MIYKDLFKIKIDGELCREGNSIKLFTIEEMRKVYLDNIDRKIEIEYDPLLASDILDDSEMYGGEYEGEEEDYEN